MVALSFAAELAACMRSPRPAPGGRLYHVLALSWNGQAITPSRAAGSDACTLRAGGQTGRFWVARQPAGPSGGGARILTATESEILEGLVLRCDRWTPAPPLGIKGPARRDQIIPDRSNERAVGHALLPEEMATGRIVIDDRAPGGDSAAPSRFHLELQLLAATAP